MLYRVVINETIPWVMEIEAEDAEYAGLYALENYFLDDDAEQLLEFYTAEISSVTEIQAVAPRQQTLDFSILLRKENET